MRVHRGLESLPSMVSNLNALRRRNFSCDHTILCVGRNDDDDDDVDDDDDGKASVVPLHSIIFQSCSSLQKDLKPGEGKVAMERKETSICQCTM